MTEQTRGHPKEQPSEPQFGLTHAFYANMGGFAFYGSYDTAEESPTAGESLFDIATRPRHTVAVPKFETLIYIMKHFPNIITNTPEDAILARAESSNLDKVVLIVQVARFGISCCSRLFQHLPLTLLEVSTAAHTFCTLVIYTVWRSKPMNVAVPTILREREAQEVYALLKCSDLEYDMALEIAGKEGTGDPGAPQVPEASAKIVLAATALRHLQAPEREQPPPEPRFKGHHRILVPGNFSNKSPGRALPVLIAITSMFYGPIYFLAWNGNFPTPRERLLWRVYSIVITCSGLVGVSVLYLLMWLNSKSRLRLGVLANVIPAIHILVSGFLTIESFRQLAFLDPAAYQLPSWANYWPHIS